ncbi:MAG: hypothetical protein KDF59_06405 [Nitrosomonas sp.]|nr:hypothetical protein [Nitrosomonas sp.]
MSVKYIININYVAIPELNIEDIAVTNICAQRRQSQNCGGKQIIKISEGFAIGGYDIQEVSEIKTISFV